MKVQIINLSFKDVFERFSIKYNIYKKVYQNGLLGFEIRKLPKETALTSQNVILKQGEICYKYRDDNTNKISLLLTGSLNIFFDLARKILSNGNEELGYSLLKYISNYEKYEEKSYTINDKIFDFKKQYVMGILNVTDDSFSDGKKFKDKNKAVKHAVNMLDNGADIIDIGGESTRPGAEKVSEKEEINRVIPIIEGLLKQKPETIISVDTSKSKVAEMALKLGAKIINDISAGRFDTKLIEVVKKYDAAYVLMHMKGEPKNMQKKPCYENIIEEVYDFLFEYANKFYKYGIKKIFIDPGIGFGKRVEDNLEIIKRLEDFKSLGFPILVGVSRKSFIGNLLNLEIDKRDTASAIIEALAIKNSAKIIRTHNVKNGVHVSNLLNNLY